MSDKDKYNISPGAQIGACGDNAEASGMTMNQTVVHRETRISTHPFVATPNEGKCSSCGKSRGSPAHDYEEKDESVISRTTVITGQQGAVGRGAKSEGNTYNKYVNGKLVETKED